MNMKNISVLHLEYNELDKTEKAIFTIINEENEIIEKVGFDSLGSTENSLFDEEKGLLALIKKHKLKEVICSDGKNISIFNIEGYSKEHNDRFNAIKDKQKYELVFANDINDVNMYEQRYLLKNFGKLPQSANTLSDDDKLELYKDVVFKGFRRYYVEDLSLRDYLLEGSTPYQLELCGEVVRSGAWSELLCNAVLMLLDKFPEKRKNVLEFRTSWTKSAIFTTELEQTNSKKLYDKLYLNCNHTAVHFCWLLQDILDFFEIDKGDVKLLIHRPSTKEPKNTRKHIETLFVVGFKAYLSMKHGYDSSKCDKVVNNIYEYLNPIFKKGKISNSYNNLFLFDDVSIFSNYKQKIKGYIRSKVKFTEEAKDVLYEYLDILGDYYKLK